MLVKSMGRMPKSAELPDWAKRRLAQLQYEIDLRQKEIDSINEKRDLQPDHVCGLSGYNPMLGDRCPACDWDSKRANNGHTHPENWGLCPSICEKCAE